MKTFLLTIFAALVMICGTSVETNAQNEFFPYSIGLNFGVGCGTVNRESNHWNNIFLPSVEFAGDLSFLPNVINRNGSVSGGIYGGIGAGSRTGYDSRLRKDVKYNASYWRGGTRGALHYSWVRNLDTYAGIAFGVKHRKIKADTKEYSDDISTDFDSYGFAGARYKFNHSVAAFSEVASSHYAWWQIGVSVLINN
ncbi:MAG: hypothetical protein IKP73_05120 [Bacteroidales bacterium]|nr:hypothetical protein [Bacteroidales bacterium]